VKYHWPAKKRTGTPAQYEKIKTAEVKKYKRYMQGKPITEDDQ
jgi:hypothetical protein